MKTIHIVGAGLSGATLARKFAEDGHKVLVFEKRDHIGGNTYDYLNEYGIRMSKYGAHIFHTSDEKVWDFVTQFTDFLPYEHKVKSRVNGKLVPVPVNIDTVNTLFDTNIKTEEEMKTWLDNETAPYKDIEKTNSEISALQRVGKRLFGLMFENYTRKQWDKEPFQLEAAVMDRIPVRTDHNDRYFSDKYEGIPSLGYTNMVRNMLEHENITLILGRDYHKAVQQDKPDYLFYTGKIDTYFGEKFGKLEYRSIEFEHHTHKTESFQEAAVVNYPSLSRPFTRIIEHKKLYMQESPYTTVTYEFSIAGGEPYYPVPNPVNRELYSKYQEEAEKLEKQGIFFVGRLANYKYFNMDQAIKNALEVYEILRGEK